MWRDALRDLALVTRDLLVAVALIVGMALTAAAAWLGLYTGPFAVYAHHGCGSKITTAKVRVMAARDAVTQYMIQTPSCPHGIDDLVAGRYLEQTYAKDPWGSALVLRCPGNNDGDGADVTSPGPDKELGTADDINSWDL
jgi:hypothetical protein